MRVILGTRNRHKLEEMTQLLPGLHLDPLPDDIPEAIEDGQTFADNARIKSTYYAQQTGCYVLADDSGLTVEALDGAPGVHSARWSGPTGTDADNNAKLLKLLEGVENRSAAYVCAVSLASPEDGELCQVEGRCEGLILDSLESGTGGFGYDPLFFSQDLNACFANVSAEDKNKVSHRGHACRELNEALEKLNLNV